MEYTRSRRLGRNLIDISVQSPRFTDEGTEANRGWLSGPRARKLKELLISVSGPQSPRKTLKFSGLLWSGSVLAAHHNRFCSFLEEGSLPHSSCRNRLHSPGKDHHSRLVSYWKRLSVKTQLKFLYYCHGVAVLQGQTLFLSFSSFFNPKSPAVLLSSMMTNCNTWHRQNSGGQSLLQVLEEKGSEFFSLKLDCEFCFEVFNCMAKSDVRCASIHHYFIRSFVCDLQPLSSLLYVSVCDASASAQPPDVSSWPSPCDLSSCASPTLTGYTYLTTMDL